MIGRPGMWRLMALVAACCLCVPAVHGAAKPPGGPAIVTKSGSLYALVVGVSKYKDSKIQTLDLADKDAGAFSEFLNNQQEVFKDTKVVSLTNEQATKLEIEKYLYYTLPKAGKDDSVILFFSGHGAFDPVRPTDFLFLPYDVQTDFPGATAVKMSGLEFLKSVTAARVLIIADTCYSGNYTAGADYNEMKAKSAASSMELFIEEVRNSSGRAIITSANKGQLSWENPKLKNSVFTAGLLEGLQGKADKDRDGVVTLHEAYEYAYTRTKDETQGRQHPKLEGNIVGAFPLAFTGPRLPPGELKKLLFKAAPEGDNETVRTVLGRFTDVNARDEDNNTPLLWAASAGRGEVMQTLIAAGADYEAVNNTRSTPLMKAALSGHAKAVKILLDAGASVNGKNVDGYSPLALAAHGGHTEVVDMLLRQGADVKARTNSGETPLSLAASAGRVDTVKSLLQWVGQLKIEDLNMQGALTNAYRSGQNEIVRLLVNKPAPIQLTGGRNERKLVFAILRGDREKADEALSGPIDIACRTDAGDTPIGIAAALGHAGIVRSLLESGDKPDTRQADGRTPLMLAARNGHLVTATALIQAGADVNAVDRERWSALILAAETGQVRMAQMLLKRGAHVDARNKSDTSALAAAAYEGHTETVKALLAASASVGITDENGNTPLMIAAAAGRLDIVKLLAKDSDLNARNKQKAGALMLAIKNRRLDTVKFLLSRGCDPSLQDWEGKTASALASERGSDEIVELLKTHQPSAAGVNE